MKHLFICLALFMCVSLSAQDTLRLSIDNPAPRIGDEVKLSFDFNFFVDEVKRQLNSEMTMANSDPIYGIQKDNFVRRIEFQSIGKHTIGPFEFTFNGETILTDSIKVEVIEALPFEAGIWVRVVTGKDGQQFLIIEQQLQNSSEEDGISNFYTTGRSTNPYSELAEVYEVPEGGLQFDFIQSHTNSRRNKEAQSFDPGFTYSFKKYEIKFDDDFSGTFVLTKKHMKNLPKKVSIKKIKITR